ncbi:MAG: DUF5711 family protein [Oscillospiraceae bacterium]|nr:DUF5711 family protein [Oscillospiraceae bacterium]
MAEIKDIRESLKKKKRAKTVRRISVLVILLSLAVIVFINRDSLSPEAISNWLSGSINTGSGEEGFPLKLPSGETVALDSAGGNIALTNQTNLYFYSARGRELRSVQHARKNVQSKVAGNNVLVYSVGGNEVSVETESKTAATLETEKAVITGDVAKNGKFAIATESDVYTSEMKVYDKNANAIFKWTPSGGVISALALSEDGSRVAAATLYTQGGKIMSGIYFFSTSKSEALFSYQLENELILSLSCDKNGVTAISDAQLLELSSDGEKMGSFSFDEKQLIGMADCSRGLAMAFRDVNDPGRSVLCVIGQKGEVKAEASVSQHVVDIACSGDNIYLLTETDLFLYEASTAIKRAECEISDDAQRLCANSSGAYVITAASEMLRPDIG